MFRPDLGSCEGDLIWKEGLCRCKGVLIRRGDLERHRWRRDVPAKAEEAGLGGTCKCRSTKERQQPAELGGGRKEPPGPQERTGSSPTTPGFGTCRLRSSERRNVCWFRAPGLWSFVTWAPGDGNRHQGHRACFSTMSNLPLPPFHDAFVHSCQMIQANLSILNLIPASKSLSSDRVASVGPGIKTFFPLSSSY